MIGKTVTFIRTEDREGMKQVKNREYTGIVLDKFRSFEKILNSRDEILYPSVDIYLVELDGGILATFFPDEAKRIVEVNHKQIAEVAL